MGSEMCIRDSSRGRDSGIDTRLDQVRSDLAQPLSEVTARRIIEKLATTWAATLMVEHGDPSVSDAYLSSRIAGDHGSLFGTLSETCDLDHISRRAVPIS